MIELRQNGMHLPICMVVHGPYPVGEPRVSREVRAARAAGHPVTVICGRRAGEPAVQFEDGVKIVRLPVEHRRGGRLRDVIREYSSFTGRAMWAVAKEDHRRPIAIVQIHNPPDFLVLSAAMPRMRGARVLLDIHDLAPDIFAMRFGGRRGARVADMLLQLTERLATKWSSEIITVHEPYREELIRRGVAPGKIQVVMNSLDESLLPSDESCFARTRDEFTIFYHGTVTPSYGVGLVVDAVAALVTKYPGLRLEVHGEGDDVPALRQEVDRLDLNEHVCITGVALPQDEVLRRAASASVGVIPNLPSRLNRFALSSKLFEYVCLGVPVVSARLPTIAAHFSEDEVLFFEPGSSESLRNALEGTMTDPSGARRRVEAAMRRYEGYRWRHSEDTYLGVLARLGEGPSRRR